MLKNEKETLIHTHSNVFALFIYPVGQLASDLTNCLIPESECSVHTSRRPAVLPTLCKWGQDARQHDTLGMLQFTLPLVRIVSQRSRFSYK
jgi:hypothetical protein